MSLQGEKQLQARFTAMSKTELVIRSIVIHGVAEAKHLVPRRTGNLGRTIRPGNITPTTGQLIAGGISHVGYAGAVESGRRAVTIRPRNKKVLAWGGPRTLGGRLRVSGGVAAKPTHFAREVHQDARPGKPYLVPGLQKAVKDEGIKAVVELWNGAA